MLLVVGGGGASFEGIGTGGAGQTVINGQNGFGTDGGAGGTNGAGGGGTNAAGENGGGGGWAGNGGNGVGIAPTPGSGSSYQAGDGGFGPPTFAGGIAGGDGTAGQYATGGFGGGDGATAAGGGGGSYIDASGTPISLVGNSNGVGVGGGRAGANGQVIINGTIFNYTGAIVSYVVPTTGSYDITAIGAQGGSGLYLGDIGGYGALAEGAFTLTAGTELDLVVGGAGLTGDFGSNWGGGGGGGSFVFETATSTPVPEPSTLALFGFGIAALGFFGWRRRSA